jgi:ABC-type polysaccharide/polyol phosphate export permease
MIARIGWPLNSGGCIAKSIPIASWALSGGLRIRLWWLSIERIVMSPHTHRALADFFNGPRSWRLWWLLAWSDIRQRYARSLLGPWWLTISTAATVTCIGVLYSFLFRSEIENYVPYVAISLIIWTYILGSIQDGTTTLIASDGICRQLNINYTMLFARSQLRNVIILLHNAAIIIAALYLFSINPSFWSIVAIAGVVSVTIILYFTSIIIGLICARYRDIAPLISSMLQLVFYVSPILWTENALPMNYQYLVDINPFYHMIEVIRAPLLGRAPSILNWLAVFAMVFLSFLLSMILMIKYRRRVPYWL